MTVVFNRIMYETTETIGYVNICVDVLTSLNNGALRPFTVALLPEPGMLHASWKFFLPCTVKYSYQLSFLLGIIRL